jgi:hypothetical protein
VPPPPPSSSNQCSFGGAGVRAPGAAHLFTGAGARAPGAGWRLLGTRFLCSSIYSVNTVKCVIEEWIVDLRRPQAPSST